MISLDLGISKQKISFNSDYVIFPNGSRIFNDDLKKILKKENNVFFIEDEKIFTIAISNNNYYKLVPTNGAPTLEINGIRMHQSKHLTPDIDTKNKIDVLNLSGGKVLDTCTGLGYTAIEAIKRNAEFVITIENDHIVYFIALKNPWSQKLFKTNSIHKILGDSYQIIDIFPNDFFDYIIHDPPRISIAGYLYSNKFYQKMYKKLKVEGRIFHYTGKPKSISHKVNLSKGIINRLKKIGFKEIIYHDEVMGITCNK